MVLRLILILNCLIINYFFLGFKGHVVDPGRILDEDLQLSETDSD